jgi:hypothetical protein
MSYGRALVTNEPAWRDSCLSIKTTYYEYLWRNFEKCHLSAKATKSEILQLEGVQQSTLPSDEVIDKILSQEKKVRMAGVSQSLVAFANTLCNILPEDKRVLGQIYIITKMSFPKQDKDEYSLTLFRQWHQMWPWVEPASNPGSSQLTASPIEVDQTNPFEVLSPSPMKKRTKEWDHHTAPLRRVWWALLVTNSPLTVKALLEDSRFQEQYTTHNEGFRPLLEQCLNISIEDWTTHLDSITELCHRIGEVLWKRIGNRFFPDSEDEKVNFMRRLLEDMDVPMELRNLVWPSYGALSLASGIKNQNALGLRLLELEHRRSPYDTQFDYAILDKDGVPVGLEMDLE